MRHARATPAKRPPRPQTARWVWALPQRGAFSGRRIALAQAAMFCAVGASGLVVHLAVLRAALSVLPSIGFAGAQALAAGVAATSNFFVNNALTFGTERLAGAAIIGGLLRFYAACMTGAIVNITLGTLAYEACGIWWLAGLAGEIPAGLTNVALSFLFVWRPGASQEPGALATAGPPPDEAQEQAIDDRPGDAAARQGTGSCEPILADRSRAP